MTTPTDGHHHKRLRCGVTRLGGGYGAGWWQVGVGRQGSVVVVVVVIVVRVVALVDAVASGAIPPHVQA